MRSGVDEWSVSHRRKGTAMSINPVAGAHAAQSTIAAAVAGKPEGKEAPGAPDTDKDGDEGKSAAPAAASRAAIVGQVNIKA